MQMSVEVCLKAINPTATQHKPVMDVLFIHGLGGDSDATWRATETEYWPQRTADSHPQVQVWVLSYPAAIGHLLDVGKQNQPGTTGLSVLITEKLRTHKIGERPCIFVCHSLGGLVVKRVLLDAWGMPIQDNTRFRHEGVKAIMFCGTPHRGSAIANALKIGEGVKNLALRTLLPYLGWLADKVGEFAAKRVLTTSDLITELEKGSEMLQFLNEDFGVYYRQRVADGFMVKVYAETEALKVKGVPTVVVVEPGSANPNLRIDERQALPVLPVPGADHSTLVKPTRPEDYVVEGLGDLIRRVAKRDYAFDVGEGVAQKVGMLIHAEFLRWEGLVKLPCLNAFKPSECTDREAAFHVARGLASLQGEALIDRLSALQMGFREIASNDPFAKEKHEGLTRIGLTMVLAYLGSHSDANVSAVFVPALHVPSLEDSEHLDIMVEVLHATIRSWPVSLKLNGKRDKLISASRVFSPSGQAPLNWREFDHLDHLVARVMADKALTADELRGTDGAAWPQAKMDNDIVIANQKRLLNIRAAKLRLKGWLHANLGYVVDAKEPTSPYASTAMQEKLGEAFGDLIALILPDPAPAPIEVLEKLVGIQTVAQQFLLAAESTRP